jgi:hypothetical protein
MKDAIMRGTMSSKMGTNDWAAPPLAGMAPMQAGKYMGTNDWVVLFLVKP